MKLRDLKAELRRRLASDPAIEAFCLERFGRSLNIIRRLDNHEPPKEPDCPWVNLEFVAHNKSNMVRMVSNTFVLACGVWVDPESNQDDVEDIVSDLRELIEGALSRPGLGEVKPGDDVFATTEDGFSENIEQITFTNT